ncbi:MAG: hypothetical protein RSA56_06280, partial [Raoultibacter sp.]
HQVITAKAEGNGSISWEGKPAVNEEFLVPENSTATFTIAPNSGSELASVVVDDTDVTSELKANTYTFDDVTAPHAIVATFTTPTPPVDPVDPPKPPVDPVDPVDPPIPPVVPDNGGGNGGNNGGGTTTIVERTNTVAAPTAPAAAAGAAAKTEAPAQAAADNATPQGQLENPTLGAKSLDLQHSHIPLILLLLAVWLVGGFTVDRQRKRTRDAIEGTAL